MTRKELLELVKLGEGLHIEFKAKFSASVGKEICAFANTIGGKILFGVNDDGTNEPGGKGRHGNTTYSRRNEGLRIK
ncbi:MAG: ATP-binding protein [bacterium]|nr:ATP-binding protein [bacterium]